MTGDATQIVVLTNGGKVTVRLSITTDLLGHSTLAAAKRAEINALLANHAAGAVAPLQELADELASRPGAFIE